MSLLAGLANGAVGLTLVRVGRRHGSITLEADGHHLLADVWTTVAILLALLGALRTGWLWLDPAIAGLAAIQIVWSGIQLIRRSIAGLLDTVLPRHEQSRIEAILDDYARQGIQFHDLRARASGHNRFVNLHVLVAGEWSVRQGHALAEEIEQAIASALANTRVVTHLEPLGDQVSFASPRQPNVCSSSSAYQSRAYTASRRQSPSGAVSPLARVDRRCPSGSYP